MNAKSSGQFPLPGVAVVLLALGAFIISDTRFEPTRPSVSNNPSNAVEEVPARLWQDPFEAVQLHRNKEHSKKSDKTNIGDIKITINLPKEKKSGENYSFVIKEKKVKGNESKDEHSEHDICKLKEHIIREYGSSNFTGNKNIKCNKESKVVTKKKSQEGVHILAVMVTGGAYAEDKENRIRSRYAVTTGLLSTGYIPTEPENIAYLDTTKFCKEDKDKVCEWPSIVPYEWYKQDKFTDSWYKKNSFAKNVLILWLDDEYISNNKPLHNLVKIRNELTKVDGEEINDKMIKFDIVGPATSTSLIKMYKDIYDEYKEGDIRVYSPRATLSSKAIKKIIGEKYVSKSTFPRLNRTVSTDDKLVEHLLCEMLRRGVNPYHDSSYIVEKKEKEKKVSENKIEKHKEEIKKYEKKIKEYKEDKKTIKAYKDKVEKHKSEIRILSLRYKNTTCTEFSKSRLNRGGKKDYIALIREGDTTYSRNFKDLFKNKIDHALTIYDPYHVDDTAPIDTSGHIDDTEHVHYSDHIHHSDELDDSDQTCKKPIKIDWLFNFSYLRGLDGEIVNKKPNSTGNKSSGKNDKSELRRAVGANQFDYLRRLSAQLKELEKDVSDKGSLRAIGIVGSDTYDKLLILQALRNHFPDTLFFTTDLDARMLHNSENKWVRNLIIASSYGLTPEKNKNVVFQGLAFRDSYQTALYNTIQKVLLKGDKHIDLPVKIFEIGNDSAVDYSHGKPSGADKDSISSFYEIIKYIALAIGLIILLFLQSNNHARMYIAGACAILCTVFLWTLLFDPGTNREFKAIFTGTSVWPAYLIRMSASALAILLIVYAYIKLKLNTIDIINKYGLSDIARKSFEDRIRNILDASNDNCFRTLLCIVRYTKNWIFKYPYLDRKTVSNRKLVITNRMSHYLITSWGARDRNNKSVSIDKLFYQYLDLGQKNIRLIRITVLSSLYIIISVFFLHSFSALPVTPFTGEVNAIASLVTRLAVLIPYIFLIFLVSDITRLNSRFVELLSKYNMSWPKETISKYCKMYGYSKEVTIEKLKLKLIVDRSIVVDKLIFLPFIILTLMILSRSSYFDRWHTPPQLAVVILLGASIALFSAVRLRLSAKNARNRALTTLKNIYKVQLYKEKVSSKLASKGFNDCSEGMSSRLNNLISEIESMSTGPFLPIAKHPIITAAAMPFGGLGGLYLLEYLTSIGI